jgi:hypothetical protein
VSRFVVEVDLVADMAGAQSVRLLLEPEAEELSVRVRPALRQDLEPFLVVDKPGRSSRNC